MPNKTDLRGERERGREEGREGEREGIKMKIKNSFHPKFFAMRFEGDENRLFKSNNFVSPPPTIPPPPITVRIAVVCHVWRTENSCSRFIADQTIRAFRIFQWWFFIVAAHRLSLLWEWKSFNRIILFFSFLSFMKSCGYLFVFFFI